MKLPEPKEVAIVYGAIYYSLTGELNYSARIYTSERAITICKSSNEMDGIWREVPISIRNPEGLGGIFECNKLLITTI